MGKRRIQDLLAITLVLTTQVFPISSSFAIENEGHYICQHTDVTKRPDEAVDCWERAARTHPESEYVHYHLGVTYVHAGDKESTRKQLKLLIEQNSDGALLLGHAIDVIQPEWVADFAEEAEELDKLYQRLLPEFEKQSKKRRAEMEAQWEVHTRSEQVKNELEFMEYARKAISRGDTEAAYRLIEDGLVSEDPEVQEKFKHLLSQHPEIHQGAVNSFSLESFKKSKNKYGESARDIENRRLSIYETIAPIQEYQKARANYESVFGPSN